MRGFPSRHPILTVVLVLVGIEAAARVLTAPSAPPVPPAPPPQPPVGPTGGVGA